MPFRGLIGVAGAVAVFCLIPLMRAQAPAQTVQQQGTASIEGKVQDSENRPVQGAAVLLEEEEPTQTRRATSDAQGRFRFASLPAGRYTLRARLAGYQECIRGPIVVSGEESKTEMLLLGKDDASAMAFSDEPSFTVAGVTDTTALGGHGSGPIVRNSNALSKQTASLGKNTESPAGATPGNLSAASPAAEETAIREKLAKNNSAELHEQLAEVEEREGRPLDAVHEYQGAAEMEPKEEYLFAWGAELLLHHAPEPAMEVFVKGRRLYPRSTRMMLGLGAAWYAQRSQEQAEKIILEACDVNPADVTPYLFLGRLQVTEPVVPSAWVERMKRFATLHPENAVAHYLYAASLMKGNADKGQADLAEAELRRALELDPHLGEAYLELGILFSRREDWPAAIAALEQAIENTTIPDDAHYRLAQIYRRTGDAEKARKEIAVFKELSEQKNEQAERERHEIPQFVYTLRQQGASPAESAPESH